MDRPTGLAVGGIPEIGIHGRHDPSAGLVDQADHIRRCLAGTDDIRIFVVRKDEFHLHPGRIQLDPEEEGMLDLIVRCLEMDIRLIHAGCQQEGAVGVDMRNGRGLRHHLTQLGPRDIRRIRNVLGPLGEFLAGKNRQG